MIWPFRHRFCNKQKLRMEGRKPPLICSLNCRRSLRVLFQVVNSAYYLSEPTLPAFQGLIYCGIINTFTEQTKLICSSSSAGNKGA